MCSRNKNSIIWKSESGKVILNVLPVFEQYSLCTTQAGLFIVHQSATLFSYTDKKMH